MDKIGRFLQNRRAGNIHCGLAIIFACVIIAFVAIQGCITVQPIKQAPPQVVTVRVITEAGDKIDKDKISKSMVVENPELQFSRYTKIHEDTAYISLTSVHSWASESMWGDFKLLKLHDIKKAILYLNNPGGSAFDGFGITDALRLLRSGGVHVTCEASGIVASAAIPILLICDRRIASRNTVFLIHPASIFKMFASETLKDVEAQAEMLKMARNKYADIVQDRSNLSRKEIFDMLEKDSWFDAEKALTWRMIDEII